MKHLLNLMNLNQDDFFKIIYRGIEHKKNRLLNANGLKNKIIALLFEKSSTRTRISFSVAIHELGGHYLVLHSNELQLGRGETIEDTTNVLSRYIHGIMIRTHSHKNLEKMAKLNIISVINGLSDMYHPCQSLADYMTIYDYGIDFKKLHIAFIGEPNNVFNSLALGSIFTESQISLATPEGFSIHPDVQKILKDNKKTLNIYKSPVEAVKNANVIYTDVWVSMGQEKESDIRKKVFKPYSVNSELLKHAPSEAIVMHCLPAHRGEEITDEVMDKFSHIIFQQSENRMHVQKALLEWIYDVI